MALINCPECGKEISDKAVSCPGCGYPVQQALATRSETKYGRTMTAAEAAEYLEEKEAEGCKIKSSDSPNLFVKALAVLALIILLPVQLIFIFITSISSWIFMALGAIGGLCWLGLLIEESALALKTWAFFAVSLGCFMLPGVASLLIGGITVLMENLKNCITS